MHGSISLLDVEDQTCHCDIVILHMQGNVGVWFALQLCNVLHETLAKRGSHFLLFVGRRESEGEDRGPA